MVKKIADNDLIELFMDSFHHIVERNFWEKLRKTTNLNRWSDIQIRINEDGTVEIQNIPVADDIVDLAAARFRKFISGGDEVYLGHVLAAAERLEDQSEWIMEARHIYNQLVDRKWPFRVHNDRAVGMYVDGMPVSWEPTLDVPLSQCSEEMLSLKDFTEVLFNEGLLHPFVPGRNEQVRSRARTVTASFRSAMQHVALAGTIYATLLLHNAFEKRGSTPCTTANCKEQRILQIYREQYEQRQAENKNPRP